MSTMTPRNSLPHRLHTTVEAQIAHGERHGFPGYREGLTYGDGYKAALRASEDVRDAVIEAQDAYIQLLQDYSASLFNLAYVHGYRCSEAQIERGSELRAKIASLKTTLAGGRHV